MTSKIAKIVAKYLAREVKKFAASDEPDRGELLGKYKITPVGNGLFWCEIDAHDPLRYRDEKTGLEFSPALGAFKTDKGSIPKIVQRVKALGLQLKEDDAERSYLIHDSAYQSGTVRVAHASADFDGNAQRPVNGEGSAGPDQALEVFAVHILHDDVMGVPVLAYVVDGDDVRVRQVGDVARFLAEPLEELRIAGQARTQYLDRYRAAQGEIGGLVDDGHAARSLLRQQPVPPVQKRLLRGHPLPILWLCTSRTPF